MPIRKVLRFEVIGATEEAVDALIEGVNDAALADWQNATTADLHVETVEELDDATYERAYHSAMYGEDWWEDDEDAHDDEPLGVELFTHEPEEG